MYQRIGERAAQAGYVHYEISSYARPGFTAVHNTLYWSGGEWLGLGSAAHSFRYLADGGGERRAKRAIRGCVSHPLHGTLARGRGRGKRPNALVASRELLSAEMLGREAMWLGLRRLAEGIDRPTYAARHGADSRPPLCERTHTPARGRLGRRRRRSHPPHPRAASSWPTRWVRISFEPPAASIYVDRPRARKRAVGGGSPATASESERESVSRVRGDGKVPPCMMQGPCGRGITMDCPCLTSITVRERSCLRSSAST